MPSASFQQSLPFILRWEGGFVDHPDDPGGRTNKGVTQSTYDGWRASRGLRARDVKGIDDAEVEAIYEAGYWLPPRCDALQDPLGLVQFDTAVNMGVGRAVRLLQRCVGCTPDGAFGPETERLAGECNPQETVRAYCDAREKYYRDLAASKPRLAVFLKGWLNRLNALRVEVGLAPRPRTFPAAPDFGDTGYVARVPDLEGDSRDF